MAAQWPLVKARLVALIPTLPGLANVEVYSGPPATQSAAASYVTVGYVEDDNGGTYQQSPADDGSVYAELGEVRCQIVANSGDSDPTVTESAAFAIADAIEASVRADRTLGRTLSPDSTAETAVDVLSVANSKGRATALVFILRYSTIT